MKHKFKSVDALRRVRRIVILFVFALLSTPAMAAVPTAIDVSIGGIPALGQLLTGEYTYGDTDGDIEGASNFLWLRDGRRIATTQNYTVVLADQGRTLFFVVRPIAATGENPGLTVVSGGVVVAPNVVPTATAVSISGVPALGELLTGLYTFDDVDGDGPGVSTFRWLRDGAPIATSQAYTVVLADQGATLVFEVTPIAATGANPGLAVASGGVVVAPNVVPTATAVSIDGIPALGELLTGLYTFDDVDGDGPGASTFRWLRDGTPIAMTQNYTVVLADQGATLVFEVTPIAATGANPGLAVPSLGVAITPNAAPTATNVIISGIPQAGEDLLGSYTYADVDGDLEGNSTFRWLRDGSPIGGARSTTYSVKGADKKASLQFEVTPVAATGEPIGSPVLSVGIDIGNVAPTITGQLPVSTAEDTALLMTLDMLTVTDIDDDTYPIGFTLEVQDGLNDNYTRVDNTITPILDFVGDLSVPVTVNDGENESAVFNVVVSVTAVNDQPVITGQEPLSTAEDASLTILVTDLTVFDPDNIFPDDFVLLLQDGANYTLAGNTLTPDANFNGDLTVLATVTDSSGELNATSAPFPLTVNVGPVNDEPVVDTLIASQVAIEGSEFDLNISDNFTDADNDVLTFTASGLPASGNLSFDSQTGVFSGTSRIEDARDNEPYTIVVTASDGQPGSNPAQTEFELNISALDRANVSLNISAAPDPAMLNDELQWTLTASNAVGPQAATNIELTGSFVGSGLNISSTSSCTIQAPDGQVSDFACSLGSLPVGGSATVVFTTTTSTAGDVVVFASALSSDVVPIDPNIADNSGQVAVGVAEAFSIGAVQVLGNAEVRSLAAGDVDGDGVVDLIAGTAAGQPIQIYLSGGFRDFATTAISLPDNSANEGVAVADFDRNGTLDLVVANGGGQGDVVYSNDGVGNFTLMATLGLTFSQDVAVGDFDNDGILDIVFATIEGNPVYLGDGFGGFALHRTLGNANSRSVAVAKLNSDARDDIVFANTGSDSNIWFKNAGDGFTQGDNLAIGDAAAVTIGEFGGDLRPDLAFGRDLSGAGDIPKNPVLINDGTGGFGAPFAVLGTSSTNDIHAADVNRDGLTDLVFINSSSVHQIWTATGSGFDLHSEQIVDADSRVGVLTELGMADVGDAGGVDLAMGGAVVSGVGIFLNDGFGNLGFGDAVPPVLTLAGNAAVSVASGSAYSDAGATAQDNIDGDISGSVVATGSVNTAVVGSYIVTYNVTDRAGNNAPPITRTVTVTTAAGTGGGGGGALSSLALLLLMIGACLSAYHAKHAIILAGEKNMNRRGIENA